MAAVDAEGVGYSPGAMDVRYSDEQQLLDTTAREIAAGIGRYDGRPGGDPSAGWATLAGAGLAGMRLPEEVGGAGAGALEVAIVVEAVAARPCRVPFLGPVLGAELLVLGGVEPALLAEVAEGSRRYVPVVGRDLRALAATGLAFDAAGADAGVSIEEGRLVGATLGEPVPTADLTRIFAPTAAVAELPGAGAVDPASTARWEALALALLAADAVGVMQGSLDEAVTHASSRSQFGRAIGAFQAVQHLCADALVRLEAARTLMWHAAWAVDALDPLEALDAARDAKAYASDAVRDVCESVIQVLGGIGVTWESVAHLYLRRGLLDRQLLGDARSQHLAIAERRLGSAA